MDRDPQELMRGAVTIADKVRRLHAAGYTRSQIADLVQRSYQQVRQVLQEDERRAARLMGAGVDERGAAYRPLPLRDATVRMGDTFRIPIALDGTIELPREVMERFGLRSGRLAIAVLEGEKLSILSRREALRQAREGIPQWREGEPLWSEELIAERRREAQRE